MSRIGVTAGTPVDTQMGVAFLERNGYFASGIPCAANPREQTLLQTLSRRQLTRLVSDICKEFGSQGIRKVLMHCNSIATAIDLATIREEHSYLTIVTPLDAYPSLAQQYRRLTILAANGQSLAGIEKVLYEHNPEISLLGFSLLPIIFPIEDGREPKIIVEEFRLELLLDLAQSFKSDAILLGCTHFPYLELEKRLLETKGILKIIDPTQSLLPLLSPQHI